MNYKSLTKISQDINYFNSIGVRSIRPHIPYYTDSESTLTSWRNCAKAFHDAGFWVTYGLSAGSIGSSTWDALSAAILTEAELCQQSNVCDDFEIGNEYELHLVDGWTTATNLIPVLKTLATSVQSVFTSGTVSYSLSQGQENNWISAGKGDIDYLGLNTYGVYKSSRYVDPASYQSAITNMHNAFGNSGSYISEFNIDFDGTRMDAVAAKHELSRAELSNMINYIKNKGYTKALLFQYCPPYDSEGAAKHYTVYNDRSFRYMWNAVINDRKRISFIET